MENREIKIDVTEEFNEFAKDGIKGCISKILGSERPGKFEKPHEKISQYIKDSLKELNLEGETIMMKGGITNKCQNPNMIDFFICNNRIVAAVTEIEGKDQYTENGLRKFISFNMYNAKTAEKIFKESFQRILDIKFNY